MFLSKIKPNAGTGKLTGAIFQSTFVCVKCEVSQVYRVYALADGRDAMPAQALPPRKSVLYEYTRQ